MARSPTCGNSSCGSWLFAAMWGVPNSPDLCWGRFSSWFLMVYPWCITALKPMALQMTQASTHPVLFSRVGSHSQGELLEIPNHLAKCLAVWLFDEKPFWSTWVRSQDMNIYELYPAFVILFLYNLFDFRQWRCTDLPFCWTSRSCTTRGL